MRFDYLLITLIFIAKEYYHYDYLGTRRRAILSQIKCYGNTFS